MKIRLHIETGMNWFGQKCMKIMENGSTKMHQTSIQHVFFLKKKGKEQDQTHLSISRIINPTLKSS